MQTCLILSIEKPIKLKKTIMIKTLVSSLILLCSLFATNVGFAQSQKEIDDKILTDYFKKNKIKKVKKSSSGLYYLVKKKGNGENAKPGQKVSMKYLGTFLDGKRFDGNMDENYELKKNPFNFVLGRGQVISGWDEGIQYFSPGSRGFIYLPSGLAYGPTAMGPIPANSVLVFQIEVISAE